MPYDAELAERIRAHFGRRADVEEKKMFGGVGFMLAGNMCVGVWKDALIVRVGAAAYAEGLTHDHAREFDVTGRPMRGWLMVDPEGIEADADLKRWIGRAVKFVETLPAK